MSVNANSVIPTQLNGYWPEAYNALTTQEDYCYTQSNKGGVTEYRPFFQDLADQMNNWLNEDWTDDVRKMIEAAYVYMLFAQNYGTANSQEQYIDAYKQLNMNGFLENAISHPDNYYDDYVAAQSNGTTTTPATASRLQSDATFVGNSISPDHNSLSSLADSMNSSYSRFSFKFMFEVPALSGNPASPQDLGTTIFQTYHWKAAFNNLNINLDLPSYV